jgi:hypothetical protein
MEAVMGTVLYVGSSEGIGEHLLGMIETQIPDEKVDVLRSGQELAERLRRPLCDVNALVLLLASKGDLETVLAFRDLLADLFVLLVLPDSEPDTISKAYRLCPRFVSYVDRGFMDVVVVLEKILERKAGFGDDRKRMAG